MPNNGDNRSPFQWRAHPVQSTVAMASSPFSSRADQSLLPLPAAAAAAATTTTAVTGVTKGKTLIDSPENEALNRRRRQSLTPEEFKGLVEKLKSSGIYTHRQTVQSVDQSLSNVEFVEVAQDGIQIALEGLSDHPVDGERAGRRLFEMQATAFKALDENTLTVPLNRSALVSLFADFSDVVSAHMDSAEHYENMLQTAKHLPSGVGIEQVDSAFREQFAQAQRTFLLATNQSELGGAAASAEDEAARIRAHEATVLRAIVESLNSAERRQSFVTDVVEPLFVDHGVPGVEAHIAAAAAAGRSADDADLLRLLVIGYGGFSRTRALFALKNDGVVALRATLLARADSAGFRALAAQVASWSELRKDDDDDGGGDGGAFTGTVGGLDYPRWKMATDRARYHLALLGEPAFPGAVGAAAAAVAALVRHMDGGDATAGGDAQEETLMSSGRLSSLTSLLGHLDMAQGRVDRDAFETDAYYRIQLDHYATIRGQNPELLQSMQLQSMLPFLAGALHTLKAGVVQTADRDTAAASVTYVWRRTLKAMLSFMSLHGLEVAAVPVDEASVKTLFETLSDRETGLSFFPSRLERHFAPSNALLGTLLSIFIDVAVAGFAVAVFVPQVRAAFRSVWNYMENEDLDLRSIMEIGAVTLILSDAAGGVSPRPIAAITAFQHLVLERADREARTIMGGEWSTSGAAESFSSLSVALVAVRASFELYALYHANRSPQQLQNAEIELAAVTARRNVPGMTDQEFVISETFRTARAQSAAVAGLARTSIGIAGQTIGIAGQTIGLVRSAMSMGWAAWLAIPFAGGYIWNNALVTNLVQFGLLDMAGAGGRRWLAPLPISVIPLLWTAYRRDLAGLLSQLRARIGIFGSLWLLSRAPGRLQIGRLQHFIGQPYFQTSMLTNRFYLNDISTPLLMLALTLSVFPRNRRQAVTGEARRLSNYVLRVVTTPRMSIEDLIAMEPPDNIEGTTETTEVGGEPLTVTTHIWTSQDRWGGEIGHVREQATPDDEAMIMRVKKRITMPDGEVFGYTNPPVQR
jgi:hypothetical protein